MKPWLAIAAFCMPMTVSAVETVRLENELIALEVTPELGGRGLAFSLKGHPNLLKTGEPVVTRPKPKVSATADDIGYLGHDVWVGPQSQWWMQQDANPVRRKARVNWPPDPFLAFADTRIVERTPSRLVLEGVDSPISGVRLRKTFQLSAARVDAVEIRVTARNIRNTDIAWDLWFNTRTPSYTRVYVPVNGDDEVRMQPSTEPTIGPLLPRVEHGLFSLDRAMLPEGVSARRGKVLIQPSAGWMAGFSGGQLFLIQFPHQPRSRIHPEQGQVELYLDDRADAAAGLLEMEVHAPYRILKPNEEMEAVEWWTVMPYDGPDTREAQVAFLCEEVAERMELANFCDERKTEAP
jgi:hypothetical protein